jgi:hypothetical protein
MKREEGFYREGAEGAKFGGRDVKGYGGLGIWDWVIWDWVIWDWVIWDWVIWDWGTGGKRTMDGRGGRGWDAEDGGLTIDDCGFLIFDFLGEMDVGGGRRGA